MSKINALASKYEALQCEHMRRLWVLYTTGFDIEVNEAQQKINAFLKDKSNYHIILDELEKDPSTLEWRAAKILHNLFKKFHYTEKANQVFEKIEKLEVKLGDVLNKHRSTLDDKEAPATTIRNILNENPDREMRKKAFVARTQVNRHLVENGFLDLIDLRKEFAALCGFDNFVAFRLDADELTPEIFTDWHALAAKEKARVQESQNQWAQKIIKEDTYMPWDMAYIANQICPANNFKVDIGNFFDPIEKTFSAYGFEISKLNLTYDVFPRKNKSEWGYSFTIYPGKDSRVLANVANKFHYYNVLLHETAHGVHFLSLNQDEKVFNQGVSGIVAEGFANFFGDLSYSEVFQNQIFNENLSSISEQFRNLKSYLKLSRTDSINNILFDQQFYNEDLKSLDDIHQLKWKFSKEILGQEPYSDEPLWGYTIHHTVAPVYLHNYLLGDLMCEKMQNVFQKRTGLAVEKAPLEFGKFWREEILGPSGKLPFLKLYEKFCGEPLKLGSFLS